MGRSMKRFLRTALLGLAIVGSYTAAFGADVGQGMSQGPGGYYDPTDRSGPYAIGADGVRRLRGGPQQGAANIATSQVTANATATQLAAQRTGRGAITIMNLGTTPVYLGAAGVTASTGILLPGTAGASVTIPTSAAVFGVASTGTQGVAVLETY